MENNPSSYKGENEITRQPMRLRWGDWRTSRIIQVHVRSAARYEDERAESLQKGRGLPGHMPAHYSLDHGMRDTAMGLLRHRNDAEAQKQVIYLAAIMETLLNAPCPILRTDLIRRVYDQVSALSAQLGMRFSGRQARFLPPLHQDAKNPAYLTQLVCRIDNLKSLFDCLQELAGQRYQTIRNNYVIYYPKQIGL